MGKKSIAEYNKTFQNVTDIIGKAVAVLPPVTSYSRSSSSGGGGGGGGGGGSCGNLASGKWASLPYKSYQKTTLTDLEVINYLKTATSDIAVRRATFAIYAVESGHGNSGVNNNYIGLQTDGGGFLGTKDLNYVTGTTTLRDSGGTCRSFATYDTWQKCIDHLIQVMINRKQSGSSSRKMVPTNPNDADYFGKGYANNWVGSGSTSASNLGKSLYISAKGAGL
jgi:hypothetical protein